LDELQEIDVVFTNQGITSTINQVLFQEAKAIHIDFLKSPNGSGFTLSSSLPAGEDVVAE